MASSINPSLRNTKLTNGGGVDEGERCRKLSNQLGFEIDPSQYIQAHTILKTLVHKYTDTPVLVLGGMRDDVRHVANKCVSQSLSL